MIIQFLVAVEIDTEEWDYDDEYVDDTDDKVWAEVVREEIMSNLESVDYVKEVGVRIMRMADQSGGDEV